MATGNSSGKSKTKFLQAGGAVALAGLCVTGVASGIACPILMGAAGTLAYAALRRTDGAACGACEPERLNADGPDAKRLSSSR
jgi:hypothetical protein